MWSGARRGQNNAPGTSRTEISAFAPDSESRVAKERPMPAPNHLEVVEAIYRAAAQPELWSPVLELIVDYVGGIAGNLVYQAPAGERSFLIPGRMREDLNALYLRQYARNPYAAAYEKLPPNRVAVGNRLVDVDAIRKSAFYADICLPQRIENQIFVSHARLQREGGIGGIALFLTSEQSEHEQRAAARLARLTEHVTRAIDLTLLISQQESSTTLFEKLIATMPGAASGAIDEPVSACGVDLSVPHGPSIRTL